MNDDYERGDEPEINPSDGDAAQAVDDVERLRAEAAEANDRALRSLAELENFRKRARRELEEERRYANAPLLRDLLPVVDNIRRTIAAAEKSSEASAIVDGFRMVLKQLEDALAKHHCVRIEALGQPFDPNFHEAITQQPSAEHPPGTVTLVATEGYKLHDRVLRPAQVIVSIAPPSG